MKTIEPLLVKTAKAGIALRAAGEQQIKACLRTLAALLEQETAALIQANQKDLGRQDPGNPRNDRLLLNEKRIKAIAGSIRKVIRLADPSGKTLDKRKLPNGLLLEKIAVPLGVVGAVYESRPNVTFDIAALCIRSRNACVLKGSSEAADTNIAALKLIHKALKQHGIDANCVTLLPPERETVAQLFAATKYVDVLIPRGSASLIQFVRENSQVPVIETGAGVCHVYVEKEADLNKAVDIVVNAKVSRPSVCNAMDTVLVDAAIAPAFLTAIQPQMEKFGVELLADPAAHKLLKGYPHLQKATAADFDREFQSLKCAVKVVKDLDDALEHIRLHSTKHSEAIVSKNKQKCRRFQQEVDAAAVYSNASTRFTDGEEFGLGAEIGISTQKLHARGPFALEKLVTEKWIITGKGQIR
ncbi:glutamate-5-semialdehyde dehydrogenase [Filimonas effusa]|uniref:Gamma-glutamyl phosphate reductase n=1 Tax=Filimonas effusa TaxID=2508721 RepID=A0A4Q1DAV9_9BACT|nr:glutamate-5-semialdehyde dehydrogenase [Filimonas effusa]RXK86551.1 glutamate-5-semialdehyde dehydrogenase [Filimonas effusa]